MILILFGIGLGFTLNQNRLLQKRLDNVEEFLHQKFFEDEE
jgi:hypothetical protein